MQRTKSLGLHMKVGNDVNITAVNAEKIMETWEEPVKILGDGVVLTKKSILALSQFIKQIRHTNVYLSLKRIFLSKAGTSPQSMATFRTQVQLGQHVHVHSCCVGFSRKGPSRRAGRHLQLWGWPRCFSSPLPAAGFSLVLPRFTLPRACSSYFRRKGLWQNEGHVCLVPGRGVVIISVGRDRAVWAELKIQRMLAEGDRWWT